jgi:hypothetical protein
MKNNKTDFHGKPRIDSVNVIAREQLLTVYNLYHRYEHLAAKLSQLDEGQKEPIEKILKTLELEIAKITDIPY